MAEEFPQEQLCRAPERGTVRTAEYDYPQHFSDFSFRTLLTKVEVIGALSRIKVECSKVRVTRGGSLRPRPL